MDGVGDLSIVKERVELAVADGTRMAAYVARPGQGGPHPGLLVFQEAFGVNHHIRGVCDRFAAEGYVAIAPELFHRTAPAGFEGSYTDFAAVAPHFQAVTTETVELDAGAAFDWLHSNAQVKPDEISSVGFCMGGRVSFIANSVLRLRAAVSFYGGGIAPGAARSRGKVACAFIVYLGWIGQTHYRGAPEGDDGRAQRADKSLCECRVLPRRPWIFLRRTRQRTSRIRRGRRGR